MEGLACCGHFDFEMKCGRESQKSRRDAGATKTESANWLELEAGTELSGERGGARGEFVNGAVSGRVVRIRYGRQ